MRKINFNKWYTYVILFSPIIFAWFIARHPILQSISYGTKQAITFVLVNVEISSLYLLQLYFAYHILQLLNKKAVLFYINNFPILVFYLILLVWVLWHIPDYSRMAETPERKDKELDLMSYILIILFFYGLVNFLLINNLSIRYFLKSANTELKQNLIDEYFNPMKRIVRISIGIIIFMIGYSVVNFYVNHEL